MALLQVCYRADFCRFSAEGMKHGSVRGEVALYGEDSDIGFGHD